MNWQELVASALTIGVAFAVRWFFSLIGFELDDALFNALVGAIVVYLLHLFGIEILRAGVRAFAPRLAAKLFR